MARSVISVSQYVFPQEIRVQFCADLLFQLVTLTVVERKQKYTSSCLRVLKKSTRFQASNWRTDFAQEIVVRVLPTYKMGDDGSTSKIPFEIVEAIFREYRYIILCHVEPSTHPTDYFPFRWDPFLQVCSLWRAVGSQTKFSANVKGSFHEVYQIHRTLETSSSYLSFAVLRDLKICSTENNTALWKDLALLASEFPNLNAVSFDGCYWENVLNFFHFFQPYRSQTTAAKLETIQLSKLNRHLQSGEPALLSLPQTDRRTLTHSLRIEQCETGITELSQIVKMFGWFPNSLRAKLEVVDIFSKVLSGTDFGLWCRRIPTPVNNLELSMFKALPFEMDPLPRPEELAEPGSLNPLFSSRHRLSHISIDGGHYGPRIINRGDIIMLTQLHQLYEADFRFCLDMDVDSELFAHTLDCGRFSCLGKLNVLVPFGSEGFTEVGVRELRKAFFKRPMGDIFLFEDGWEDAYNR